MSASRFGPYRLVSELGSGAQATVHLAEVVEPREGLEPGDRVALKILHEHLGQQGGAVQRFDREVHLLTAIQHENVLRLLDAGVLEVPGGTRHYLVTELVEGLTLRSLLEDSGKQAEALCRYVGRSVARGLAAIHRAGAVHRDLKPENVILTKDQRVKVMDLGVALLRDDLRLSRSGEFVGSILYAAPEQFVTHEREVDGRADLYSLGLLLYELLTGRHPFDGEGLAAIMAQHLKGQVPRPSALAPQVSPFFEAFLLELLAKRPEERPDDADVAADALESGEASSWWRSHERLHLERARAFRPAAPRESTLCGRRAELDVVRRLWADAQTGDGRALLVLGEAGIGKTRFIDEFAEQLHASTSSFHLLRGSYAAGGAATATGAFSSAYVEFLGSSGLEEALGPLLEASPALAAPFADFLRGVPPPPGQLPLSTDGLHTAFIRVAHALAKQRPLLIVVDDLHYAPKEGQALFAALAQAVAGHPILIVGLSRPDLPAEWRANLQRLPHVDTLALPRLSPEDVDRLLAEALGSRTSAAQLSARVSALTDGNPFFILETLRAQRDAGGLERQADGSWRLRTRAEELTAPAVVRDLVEARVADLEASERDLLDLAAVCGFRFDPAVLAEVLEKPRLPVLRDLSRLERSRHLVVADGHAYRFDHHLVHETLYELVPSPLRREYHAAVGQALRTRIEAAPSRPEEEALTVQACHHLLLGDRGGQALRIFDRALAHLEQQHLVEAASDLLGSVLAVPGLVEGSRRAELLLKQSEHLSTIGRPQDRGRTIEEASRLANAMGDDGLRSDVEAHRADYLVRRGRWDDALAAAQRAQAAAQAAHDVPRELTAMSSQGTAHLNAGRHAEARASYEEVLGIATRDGNQLQEATALCNLARPLAALGEEDAAFDAYRKALGIFTTMGRAKEEAVTAGNFGSQLQMAGRHDEAEPLLGRSLDLSRSIGYRLGEANALGNLGLMLYAQGRLGAALDHLDRSVALMTELGHVAQRAHVLEMQAFVHVRLGRWESSRALFREALGVWDELAAPRAKLFALCGLADVESDAGRHAEAVGLMREALEAPEFAEDAATQGTLVGCLATALMAGGRVDEATAALEDALARQEPPDIDLLAMASALGLVDAGRAEARFEREGQHENFHARLTTLLWLWRATKKRVHIERAGALLDAIVRHAPDADRNGLLSRVPLYRDIDAARRGVGSPTPRAREEA